MENTMPLSTCEEFCDLVARVDDRPDLEYVIAGNPYQLVSYDGQRIKAVHSGLHLYMADDDVTIMLVWENRALFNGQPIENVIERPRDMLCPPSIVGNARIMSLRFCVGDVTVTGVFNVEMTESGFSLFTTRLAFRAMRGEEDVSDKYCAHGTFPNEDDPMYWPMDSTDRSAMFKVNTRSSSLCNSDEETQWMHCVETDVVYETIMQTSSKGAAKMGEYLKAGHNLKVVDDVAVTVTGIVRLNGLSELCEANKSGRFGNVVVTTHASDEPMWVNRTPCTCEVFYGTTEVTIKFYSYPNCPFIIEDQNVALMDLVVPVAKPKRRRVEFEHMPAAQREETLAAMQATHAKLKAEGPAKRVQRLHGAATDYKKRGKAIIDSVPVGEMVAVYLGYDGGNETFASLVRREEGVSIYPLMDRPIVHFADLPSRLEVIDTVSMGAKKSANAPRLIFNNGIYAQPGCADDDIQAFMNCRRTSYAFANARADATIAALRAMPAADLLALKIRVDFDVKTVCVYGFPQDATVRRIRGTITGMYFHEDGSLLFHTEAPTHCSITLQKHGAVATNKLDKNGKKKSERPILRNVCAVMFGAYAVADCLTVNPSRIGDPKYGAFAVGVDNGVKEDLANHTNNHVHWDVFGARDDLKARPDRRIVVFFREAEVVAAAGDVSHTFTCKKYELAVANRDLVN